MAGNRGRPRKSEARDTRRLIIEASLDVFGQFGYQGATIRQIAKRVGIRESSIYAHFVGKGEILKAIVEAHGPSQPLNRLKTVNPAEVVENPAAVIRRIGEAIAELWTRETNTKFVRLMAMEQLSGSAQLPTEVAESYDEITRTFSALFGALMERGLIKGHSAEALTVEFVGSLMHIRHQNVLVNPSPDMKSFRERIHQQVEHFIKRSGWE